MQDVYVAATLEGIRGGNIAPRLIEIIHGNRRRYSGYELYETLWSLVKADVELVCKLHFFLCGAFTADVVQHMFQIAGAE